GGVSSRRRAFRQSLTGCDIDEADEVLAAGFASRMTIVACDEKAQALRDDKSRRAQDTSQFFASGRKAAKEGGAPAVRAFPLLQKPGIGGFAAFNRETAPVLSRCACRRQ